MLAFLWLVANVVMIIFIVKTLITKDSEKKKKNRTIWLVSLGAAVILFIIIGISGGSKSEDQDENIQQAKETVKEQPTKVETAKDSETTVKETEKTETPMPNIEEPKAPEEFEVFINPTATFEGNTVVFDITTNLPDDAKLMLTLSAGDYNINSSFTAQTYVTVSNGKARSEGFSNKGQKLSGTFDLDISMGQPDTQAEAVRKVIGEKGELMKGALVKQADFTGVNYIRALFNISIGEDISIAAIDDFNNTTFREDDENGEVDLSVLGETSAASNKEQKVKKTVQGYIDDKYTLTTIDRVEVNPDYGTDAADDYIALVYLTWDQKNTGKTSKEVLDLYSQDMAVRMYGDLPEIQELCVFWTVPYLNNGSAKISFERSNGGMMITDTVFDKNFD